MRQHHTKLIFIEEGFRNEEWNGGERNWDYGSEAAVAVATGEINGKKYMVALFKTTAVTNPEYNPNPDKN